MKTIGISVFITEGCRLTKESSAKLVKHTETIFRNNGFLLRFPIISTTYVEKIMDNGVSIFDFDLNNNTTLSNIVSQNPNFISVEKHKALSLFPKNDTINLVLVKSLHDTGIDSYPSSLTFKDTNTIFISEACYESSLAHSMMNHFGVDNQYHDPKCLSYGCECLLKDTLMSEDEKLLISEEIKENILV